MNFLGQSSLHRGGRLVPHAGQYVGVSVQREGYGSVPQKLLDELGVVATGLQQRGARVPEIVKPDVSQPGPLQQRLEGRSGNVMGVERPSAMSTEDEAVVFPEAAGLQALGVLGGPVRG